MYSHALASLDKIADPEDAVFELNYQRGDALHSTSPDGTTRRWSHCIARFDEKPRTTSIC